jgi:hypothetical protein
MKNSWTQYHNFDQGFLYKVSKGAYLIELIQGKKASRDGTIDSPFVEC